MAEETVFIPAVHEAPAPTPAAAVALPTLQQLIDTATTAARQEQKAADEAAAAAKQAPPKPVPVTVPPVDGEHVFAGGRPLDNISDDRKRAYALEAKKLSPQQLLDARKG